ncbi:MAG: FmdB family zinc ribbon protein [Vicinamibacterales bacterium]
MPLYEYECESCGRRFERIQKYSDPPVDVCAHCGKGPVRKLISSPAIQFKGTGWYVTDYARKSSTDAGPTKTDSGEKGERGDKKTDAGGSAPASDSASKPSSASTKKD